MNTIQSNPDPWLLQVTDLKQHDYCPRIVYYHYCLPNVRPSTYKMQAGIAAQDRVAALEERRSLRAYGVDAGTRHFNVSVSSLSLGCSGQVDLVIETNEDGQRTLIPVDFKLSRRKPGRHFKLQLACYALLLEENWSLPVSRGVIYLIPRKQAVPVPITTRLRNDARRQLHQIREMMVTQRMPPPTKQRSKCVNCEFRRFCNDVL